MINKQIKQKHLEKLNHRKQMMFAIFCAEQVFHLVNSEHKEACRAAIDTTKLWLEGKANAEACRKASANAANAANAAAYAANAANAANTAYAAANATHAAANAAYAAYAGANATYVTAAYAAAAHAAYAAAYAAHAANATAHIKEKEKTVQEQWNYYDMLLNIDKHFEEIVLGKIYEST